MDVLGRSYETALLERAISESFDAQKRALLITGSPGIGKSTMLAWGLDYARKKKAACATAHSPAAGGLPPHFLINEILQGLVDDLREQSKQVSELLSKTISQFSGGKSPDSMHPDVIKLSKALQDACHEGPIGIFIDDIQWAPEEDLKALFVALQLLRGSAVLLMTERTHSPRTWRSAFPDLTADLQLERLDLAGLSIDAIGQLATRVLDGAVLPSFLNELHEQTLGNPLFVTETLRSWKASGAVLPLAGGYWGFANPEARPVADSLVQMIRSRLNSIEQAGVDTATVLAMLRRPATVGELARILERTPEQIGEQLSSLEQQEFVKRAPSTVGRYQLAHPLHESVLLDGMPAPARAGLHGRIYAALTQAAEKSGRSELAYHASNALEPPEELASLLQAAAEDAERTGSLPDAARWYKELAVHAKTDNLRALAFAGCGRALERTEPSLAAEYYSKALSLIPQGEERADVLMGRALTFRLGGMHAEALNDLNEAASIASPTKALYARDAAILVRAMGGDTTGAESEWRRLAEEAIGTDAHARILHDQAFIPYVRGRVRESKDLILRALAACENRNDSRDIRVNLVWFLALLGEWNEAESLILELLPEVSSANDVWSLIPLLNSASQLAAWKGQIEKAVDLGLSAVGISAVHPILPQERISAIDALAHALIERGAPHEALGILGEVPKIINDQPENYEVQPAYMLMSEASLIIGDLSGADRYLEEARAYLPNNLSYAVSADRVEAQIAVNSGDAGRALRAVERWLAEPSELPLEQGRIQEAAARAYARRGDRESSLEQARNAEAIYERLGAQRRLDELMHWVEKNNRRGPGRPRNQDRTTLTTREVEILKLLAQGKTNSEIGATLFISPGTVKKHIENIKSKAGVHRRIELAAFAISLNL